MATKPATEYENNPFMIGIEGLKLLFNKAKSTGIYAIALTASAFVFGIIFYIAMVIIDIATGGESNTSTNSVELTQFDPAYVGIVAAFIVIGTLAYAAISLLLFGPLDYAAAMTAQGKQVSLKEGFKSTLRNFGSYFWLYFLYAIKVFLWTLLLIIPGIIMSVRYTLAGTVFFAEGKRGNAALKRSAELTKGAWLTTYSGTYIWNILSQGLTMLVFWPGSMGVQYRQLSAITDSNSIKPKAHVISWLTLLVPLGLAVLYVLFLVSLVVLLAVSSTAP